MSSPTTSPERANAGRGIGALVLTAFGGLWLYNALYLGHAAGFWLVATGSVAAALSIASIVSIRRAARETGKLERLPRAVARKFWLVFGLEAAGVVAAIWLLQLWHGERYIVAAIAGIVGIHFLPLANLFRSPLYYATGAALVVWPASLLATMPAALQRDVAIAYGAGVILWATAFLVLAIRRR